MAAEHAQKAAEQRLAEAVSDAQQAERDDNAVQRRLADQAGTIMGLQHSLQSAQADLHKFHSAHARYPYLLRHYDAHLYTKFVR